MDEIEWLDKIEEIKLRKGQIYDIELEVNEKEKQQLIVILNKNNMYYTSKDKSIKIHLYGCFKGKMLVKK